MKGAWVRSPERKKAYINGTMRGSVAVLGSGKREGGRRPGTAGEKSPRPSKFNILLISIPKLG
jgi:hypothetical protein